jgi:hypothetical protein
MAPVGSYRQLSALKSFVADALKRSWVTQIRIWQFSCFFFRGFVCSPEVQAYFHIKHVRKIEYDDGQHIGRGQNCLPCGR